MQLVQTPYRGDYPAPGDVGVITSIQRIKPGHDHYNENPAHMTYHVEFFRLAGTTYEMVRKQLRRVK